MGFLFNKKNSEKIIAIFDIGSGNISGAIIKIHNNQKGIPIILKSVNNISILYDKDFNKYIENMSDGVDRVSKLLLEQKTKAPDEIHCILSSPWYISETRIIKKDEEKSFLFTSDLAFSLINNEIESFKNLYNNSHENEKLTSIVFEQNIMEILLNGYPSLKPVDTRCKSLNIKLFVSISPYVCLNKIKESIFNNFHRTNVSFSSFTFDAYLAIKNKYVNQNSFLLIDIRGEMTDIGIITNGIIKTTLSFPFGKNSFFNEIALKLKIEYRDALELFKLHQENHLNEKIKNNINSIILEINKKWFDFFIKSMETLPRTLIIPNTLFLSADNDIKSWFSDAIKNNNDINQYIPLNNRMVITINGPEFLNVCEIQNGNCDPFLMIETIAMSHKS